MISWKHLTTEAELDYYFELSKFSPVLFFKHSTRCSISSMALNRFERAWPDNTPAIPVFLDLIRYRNISNLLESMCRVTHQSPQVLLVIDGRCVGNQSHAAINQALIPLI